MIFFTITPNVFFRLFLDRAAMAGPGIISFVRTEKYSSDVAEELDQIRRDLDFVDFTITIHNKRFPCHKLMLAAHSPCSKVHVES